MPHSSSVRILFILVFSLTKVTSTCAQYLPEDGRLNFTGLATKYGLTSQEYKLVTEDGYIITLYHVPGDKTRPVLLMHGIIDSSDTFMIRGNTSMVATLARAGYDVWVGNNRGNRYSRGHVTLNPDTDKEYWNFSFHEIAIYDLPAMIDHILNHTGQTKVTCIGHSQGNTVFYALGSMRPEYNAKIQLMIAMSPICYLSHLPAPAKYVVRSWPLISNVLAVVGQEEIFREDSPEKTITKTVCTAKNSYSICGRGVILAVAGNDPEELEPEFLPILFGHYPSGISRKVGTHLLQQGLKESFSQMDYGPVGNLAAYNSVIPPEYDLSKVTMRVALLAAANDGMCSLTDVEILRKRLPNVVDYHVLKWRKFNHVDYVWGRNMDKHLYPKVFSLLEQYGK